MPFVSLPEAVSFLRVQRTRKKIPGKARIPASAYAGGPPPLAVVFFCNKTDVKKTAISRAVRAHAFRFAPSIPPCNLKKAWPAPVQIFSLIIIFPAAIIISRKRNMIALCINTDKKTGFSYYWYFYSKERL